MELPGPIESDLVPGDLVIRPAADRDRDRSRGRIRGDDHGRRLAHQRCHVRGGHGGLPLGTSPSSPTITEWTPGDHTVSIVYNTYTGLPDTGSFQWTFRVG